MASLETRAANGPASAVGLCEVTAPGPADHHHTGEPLEAIRESENQTNDPITPTKQPRKSRGHPHPARKPVNVAEPLDAPTDVSPDDDVARPANDQNYHVSSTTTKFFTIGYLALFSILGTLARLGLQALTSYPQAPLSQGLVWANFAGSFIMGYLSEERTLFREEWGTPADPKAKLEQEKPVEVDAAAEKKRHGAVKKTIPLFIGLATGFCGSFTSFSSFQRDVFLNLANSVAYEGRTYPVARDGGYSFLALLASLIITPCLSLAALSGGAHFAVMTERFTPSIPFVIMRGLFDPFLSFLGFGCWFGAVIMAIWPPDRPHGPANPMHHKWDRETWRGQAIFALVFAPLGAVMRYYVSMWLNPRIASFPLGTFSVNMFGTLFETIFFDLQHAPLAGNAIGGGIVGCQVLQGLQDGFCGCLTTVSTWVAELKALKKAHAYFYGLLSLLVGLGITVIVMGSLRWTQGFASPKCVVG